MISCCVGVQIHVRCLLLIVFVINFTDFEMCGLVYYVYKNWIGFLCGSDVVGKNPSTKMRNITKIYIVLNTNPKSLSWLLAEKIRDGQR